MASNSTSSHTIEGGLQLSDYLRKLIEKKCARHDLAPAYQPVYSAILRQDWESVRNFIDSDPESVTVKITDADETILHLVSESPGAVSLVEKIVDMVNEEKLSESTDMYGNTALSRVVTLGNSRAAKIMVEKDRRLAVMENADGHSPLDQAARFGHEECVSSLLAVSGDHDARCFCGEKGARLLMYLISSNLFGIALRLLEQHPDILSERNRYRKSAFEKLARTPLAFPSGAQLGFWQHFIYNRIPVSVAKSTNSSAKTAHLKSLRQISLPLGGIFKYFNEFIWDVLKNIAPSIKHIHNTKLRQMQALELARAMINGVTWTDEEANETLRTLVIVAARLGNYEIVDEVIKVYPASVIYLDDDGRSVFQRAVMFRNDKVVSLLHGMPIVKQWVMSFKEYVPPYFKTMNNILHLAARLGPSTQVPGAAFQMQRELQWFKAVERLVHPSLQQEENSTYETPRERFTKEHKALAKSGEEWMKTTATSSTVVAALIITVAFAAAFTPPGGTDDKGTPHLAGETAFLVYGICDALALFSSAASVLMFLGILTSRYAEDDFLLSLPQQLIIGQVTLFFSIANMIVGFVAALKLLMMHSIKWIVIPVGLLACVPVSLFAGLQFPLLVAMILSTYGSGFLQPRHDILDHQSINKEGSHSLYMFKKCGRCRLTQLV